MIVLKFGGTSVLDADRIKHVATILKSYHAKKIKIAAVFSAFGGVTDQLIEASRMAAANDQHAFITLKEIEKRHIDAVKKLLNKNLLDKTLAHVNLSLKELTDMIHGVFLVRELSDRSLDFIASFGERLSAYIISQYLKEQRINVDFTDTRDLIKTDKHFGSAHVDFTKTNVNLKKYFRDLKSTAIVTGFIGSSKEGETTTLGRGGSDYTAAIIGAALDAKEIHIWTDVDGVLTADPRKVKKAFPLLHLTYEEAMEMSHFGAKVIHPPTIQPALAKGIPLRIKNTFNPDYDGTLITQKSKGQEFMIKGISSIDKISLLTMMGSGMIGVAGISARLFGALAKNKISAILITQGSSEHSISFAVVPADAEHAQHAIREEFSLEMKAKLINEIKVEKNLSIIAIIGENMKHVPGISGRLFGALGKNGINVVATAQGSSELNISVVINDQNLSKALNAIHESFFLSGTKTLNIFMVGVGLIGKTLIEQINKQAAYLKQNKALELNFIGVANSKKMFFNENGIARKNISQQLEYAKQTMSMKSFVKEMCALNLPNSVFVDNTANADVASFYNEILESSISVVTPNKVANSGTYAQYLKLKNSAAKRNVKFLYETNVGAGLPVITTLNDLMTSGDKILKIEAVLSGTLSFIFNNYKHPKKFSDIVKEAQEKGYTEPDPRTDLSGLDVMRKLLILARECGIGLESNDITIQKLLPPECMKPKTIPDFYIALQKADTHFEKMRDAAEQKGNMLRFIASLDGTKASISLQEVNQSHPFYNLSGSDNIISFTTERYKERPLVIKGPGAGAEVTAAGVFAEIIGISNYLS